MKKKKDLYSLDKKNNPLIWSIEWDDNENWYTMASGRVDGSITKTLPTFCSGKNQGKSNETTDISQCALEVQARIEKQYKKDFHDQIPAQKRFEVTLAKEFTARKKFIKFPMLVSAKLDGFRCYISKDGMFSRQHNKILSCPHIFEQLNYIFEIDSDLIFDGELYSHELCGDFNKVASLISRTKNIDASFLAETKKLINFNIFDTFHPNETRPFTERFMCGFQNPQNLFLEKIGLDPTNLYQVCQFTVNSFDEVEEMITRAINEGFEGVMLRNPNMLYDNGRSSDLIKYKKFKDSEYKIIDIEDGLGNASGLASTIICETENNIKFSAGLGKGWNESNKREMFLNKNEYLGKMATIVYQELTPDLNIPRFGKLKTIRTGL